MRNVGADAGRRRWPRSGSAGRGAAFGRIGEGASCCRNCSGGGVTIADVLCSQRLARKFPREKVNKPVAIRNSITINRTPEELYRFWRNFENLPRIMDRLESVHVRDEPAN